LHNCAFISQKVSWDFETFLSEKRRENNCMLGKNSIFVEILRVKKKVETIMEQPETVALT